MVDVPSIADLMVGRQRPAPVRVEVTSGHICDESRTPSVQLGHGQSPDQVTEVGRTVLAAPSGVDISTEEHRIAGQLLRESHAGRRDQNHPDQPVPDQPGATLTDRFGGSVARVSAPFLKVDDDVISEAPGEDMSRLRRGPSRPRRRPHRCPPRRWIHPAARAAGNGDHLERLIDEHHIVDSPAQCPLWRGSPGSSTDDHAPNRIFDA